MSHAPRRLTAGIVDVSFGAGVTVVEPVNLYGCVLGDGVFVGPFVEIQRGVTIGARTRVQSHAFVCEKVTIGADCFVGHGVRFTNDRMRTGAPSYEPAGWEPTVVGDHVSIGNGAVVLPVRIAARVVIGAGAVVTRDLLDPGVYAGNPARKLRPL
jgi:acetyltransferase-like isoleucine patch superfamily enzyme